MWHRMSPDNSYVREVSFGGGDNCLSIISEEEAKEAIISFGGTEEQFYCSDPKVIEEW